MRYWIAVGMILHATVALAEVSSTQQDHVTNGNRYFNSLQYEKATEEFVLACQGDANALRLYQMAKCYEEMAGLTDNGFEIMKNKRRVLKLYENYLRESQQEDPLREKARARTEPLRRRSRNWR